MIGNAHLDPVWFWRWPAGVAEVLLTCRAAADLLEEYPQFIFTRSDVWVYEQIEALDPALFARIKRLAGEGRWNVVGGWYVQPDCNLPTGESFRRHMAIGRDHHERRFGAPCTVGYNVDSFGHAATLPSLLREYGYDSYVFMRPGPHEKELPGNLFRWRSPDGSEVIAWRIFERYNVDSPDTMTDYISRLVSECRTEGVDHVMCFYGVGNHGGGPTRRMIEWIIAHGGAIPGCELVFSTPQRFFDAVRPHAAVLPVVHDELQMHAIGCYSVEREVKAQVRRAEHLAAVAERTVARFADDAPGGAGTVLQEAWRHILFNQFHDIYDGTSVPDAYTDARDQLGASASSLSELYHATLFRALLRGKPDEHHRLMVYNPSSVDFAGHIAHEPWLDWRLFSGELTGPDGEPVPYQVVQQPSVSGSKRMILWKADVPATEFVPYRLRHSGKPTAHRTNDIRVGTAWIENRHWRVDADAGSSSVSLRPARDERHPLMPLTVGIHFIDDPSDTWSHDMTGFSQVPREQLRFSRTGVQEDGPIRAVVHGEGTCGRSDVAVCAILYSDSPVAEIRVAVTWVERLTLAKLVFGFGGEVASRLDGVPAGRLERRQNGYEYPVIDSTIVAGDGGRGCAIVGPDAFGIDGIGNSVRYTLLRSPAYAWQGKNGGVKANEPHRWTDRGEHRFRFFVRLDADHHECERIAAGAHEPPFVTDWTVGVTSERGEGTFIAPWA